MMERSDGIYCDAVFSKCRTWRYSLHRIWDNSKSHVLFVLLNPSTADECEDDPTLRRGITYARKWNYGGVVFCNLFAFRTTYPDELKAAEDPIGPDNNRWIRREAALAGLVVVAWGVPGTRLNRDRQVIQLLKEYGELYCLKKTKHGHPSHPLYLSGNLVPTRFVDVSKV